MTKLRETSKENLHYAFLPEHPAQSQTKTLTTLALMKGKQKWSFYLSFKMLLTNICFNSFDVETFSLISEVSGQWSGLVLVPTLDPEEDLCSTVLSIQLVLLWRGIPGSSKEDWRERSQILNCINLLGLNNEVYRSHLEIKRRLIEMVLQVASNELKQLAPYTVSRSNVLINCQHAIRWVYDLVVLDPHEDESKRMSLKLLELTQFSKFLTFSKKISPSENQQKFILLHLVLLITFQLFLQIESEV